MERTFYVPYVTTDNDWRASFTGNYKYDTVSIRGIFSTQEKAEAAIKGWMYENYNYQIESFTFDDEEEDYYSSIVYDEDDEEDDDEEDEEITGFSIDYEERILNIRVKNNSSQYKLDEIYDEEWSALYDPKHNLGFDDF